MEITKIAVFGLVAALMCVVLRPYKSEYAMIIGLCAGAMMLCFVISLIGEIIGSLNILVKSTGIDGAYFEILFKVLGITYLVQFASDVCRDAGEGAIGSKIELGGKALIMYISLPVFMAAFKIISELIR